MPEPLKIAFAGTPEFAARHLQALIAGRHQVVAVLTQPDRPSGRGKQLRFSAVKSVAVDADLPVLQPESLKPPESEALIAALNADVLVVVAYGLILPANILALPRLGCINVHASLLPRWRGAAPVQRAIEAGDTETGVSIMAMDAGLDTGPVLLRRRVAITEVHTAGSLLDDLADAGATALAESLDNLDGLLAKAETQSDAGVSYANKIDKTEAALRWARPASALALQIRAFQPAPGCYTYLGQDRLKILEARALSDHPDAEPGTILSVDGAGLHIACGQGVLCVTTAQVPGAKPQAIATLINGYRDRLLPGRVLSSDTPP